MSEKVRFIGVLLSDALQLTGMIKSWKHKGIKKFFETGSQSSILAAHSGRLKIILQRLNAASQPEDMNTPSMKFHKLVGNLTGHYAVTVNKNWRVTFRFDGSDVIDVNYIDYH